MPLAIKSANNTSRRPSRYRFRTRLEALEDRCVPSAGTLDPSFGTAGIVRTAIGAGANGQDLVIQNDGKLVAAGATWDSNENHDFALARYHGDGSLDSSFGAGGTVTTAFGKKNEGANAVLLQADGKIVAGGAADMNTSKKPAVDFRFALARYNPDGTLDSTFGASSGGKGNKTSSGGKVTTKIGQGSYEEVLDLSLQSDGKIVAVGYANSSTADIAVGRYHADGTLDASFDGDGKLMLDLGGAEAAHGLVIDGDGKLVLAGRSGILNTSDSEGFLVRLNTDGSLDTGFGTGGVVTITDANGAWQLRDVGLQGGKIVVAGTFVDYSSGTNERLLAVARFHTDGSLDTTFGSGGTTLTPEPWSISGFEALALGVDSVGRIVVTATGTVLVRYTAEGSLDSTFGTNGIAGGDIDGNGVKLQSDGKIVLVGSGGGFALARYFGEDSSALVASSTANHAAGETLTADQVEPLLAEAITRWQAAGADISGLTDVQIVIADLSGATLGMASGNTVFLDINAAGWGWFVDSTPWDDSEFTTPGNQGEINRMDLLSVLLHEVGHLLGQEHEQDGVMQETLSAGERLTPHDGEVNDYSWLIGLPDSTKKRNPFARWL